MGQVFGQPALGELVAYDFDGSGFVDFGDYFILFADAFGQQVPPELAGFDWDKDGRLSLEDFFSFADALKRPDRIDPPGGELERGPDFDRDGSIGLTDFFAFADVFGSSAAPVLAIYDLNESNSVDLGDFFLFADAFGRESGAKLPLLAAAPSPYALGLQLSRRRDRVYLKVDPPLNKQVRGYGLTLVYDPATTRFVGSAPGPPKGLTLVQELDAGTLALASAWSKSGGGGLELTFEAFDGLPRFVVDRAALRHSDGQLRPLAQLPRRLAVVPDGFALEGNYPNPFNPTTTISYQLPRAAAVELAVFDLLGQRVKTLVDTKQGAGFYQVVWNGRDSAGHPVGSGVYLYRMRAPAFEATGKLVLAR